ncbi:MAG: hypothetical protein JNK05_39465 [Myxococcales bacterium]|nr:hypothetical protein [Myxococcales bacterium]
MQITNNRLLTTMPMDLIGAFVIGETPIVAARISTPQVRKIANIQVVPTALSLGTAPAFVVPTDPNVAVFSNITLGRQEEIQVEAAGTGPGLTTYAFLMLQDKYVAAPTGPRYWVRFSGTQASVATNPFQWQSAAFTFEDTLAAGTYAVIGLELQGAGVLSARLTFDNQVLRPGTIGTEAAGQRTADVFYDGSLGEWGRFESYSPPRLEMFAVTSATVINFTGALQVVYLGSKDNGKAQAG